MKTKIKIILMLLMVINSMGKSYGQIFYNSVSDLFGPLGYYDSGGNLVPGTATSGTVIMPGATCPSDLDLDSYLQSSGNKLPLIIPSGVILEGTYDLLSEQTPTGAATSPSGTRIYTTQYRHTYDYGQTSGSGYGPSKMYIFQMQPGDYPNNPNSPGITTIRNIIFI